MSRDVVEDTYIHTYIHTYMYTHTRRVIIRGDNVAGVCRIVEDSHWEHDAFPRIFAYACTRARIAEQKIKFTGA